MEDKYIILIFIIFLLFQKWFWILITISLGLGAIASFFTMIASIIHFQILGALGFFILMIILTLISGGIADKIRT